LAGESGSWGIKVMKREVLGDVLARDDDERVVRCGQECGEWFWHVAVAEEPHGVEYFLGFSRDARESF
jgi:hypothetical protein